MAADLDDAVEAAAVPDTAAVLDTLHEAASYQTSLIGALTSVREHDSHFTDALRTIHENITDPSGPIAGLEDAADAIDDVPAALEDARDAHDRIDRDHLRELDVEITFEASE